MLFFTVSGAPVSKTAPLQLLRVMKLTILLLIAVYLQANAGYGQKLAVSGNNISSEKVYAMIKKQTGYAFFYDYGGLQGTKNVSLDVKNARVDKVMKACLWDQGLDFSVTGKVITKGKKEAVSVLTGPFHSIKVNGFVYNESRQSLAGADIVIKVSEKVTNTMQIFLVIARNELDKVEVQAYGTTTHYFRGQICNFISPLDLPYISDWDSAESP